MAIGLSSDELLDEALAAFGRRLDELAGQIDGAIAGENPALVEMWAKVATKYPKIPPEALMGGMVVTRALMDVIEANNRAIAAAVPHVEPSA